MRSLLVVHIRGVRSKVNNSNRKAAKKGPLALPKSESRRPLEGGVIRATIRPTLRLGLEGWLEPVSPDEETLPPPDTCSLTLWGSVQKYQQVM